MAIISEWEDLPNHKKRDAVNALNAWHWIKKIIIGLVILTVMLLAGCPPYNVWQRTLSGKAALKQAEWDRQILIEVAQAKATAAVSLAEAEVARAVGVAEANEIIAEGLGGPEGYLRYLWIQTLEGGHKDIIYIPTEANIPILEATRLEK